MGLKIMSLPYEVNMLLDNFTFSNHTKKFSLFSKAEEAGGAKLPPEVVKRLLFRAEDQLKNVEENIQSYNATVLSLAEVYENL